MGTGASSKEGQAPKPRADVGVDRRALLLQVGAKVFSEQSYDDVSLKDITDRAGVAHALLFHYFGTKRGFFLALLEHELELSSAGFEANTEPDPTKWIRKELRIFLADVEDDASMFAALIHGSLGAESEVSKIVRKQRDAAVTRVMRKLNPERQSDLLTSAISAWVAASTELVVQWLEAGRPVSKRQLERHMIVTLNVSLRSVASVDRKSAFDPGAFAEA